MKKSEALKAIPVISKYIAINYEGEEHDDMQNKLDQIREVIKNGK